MNTKRSVAISATTIAAAAAAAGGLATLRRRSGGGPGSEDVAGTLTGAPVALERFTRRGDGMRGASRVVAPSWEPPLLTAFAQWEPKPCTTIAGRTAAYLWAAPISAVGLAVGLATAVLPSVRDGVLLFEKAGGLPGAILRRRGYDASALGHVVICRAEPTPALLAHELVHVRQAERLGVFMAPVYLGLLAAYGYARHPMERAARRVQRRMLGAP